MTNPADRVDMITSVRRRRRYAATSAQHRRLGAVGAERQFGRPGRIPRHGLACLLLAVGILAGGGASAADRTIKLAVDQETTIALQENPTTGYRWSIDAKASANLALLRIQDRGFAPSAGGRPLVGAPGVHRWSIGASSAGSASVSFVYGRPWEAAPIRRHSVAIEAAAR